LNSPTSLKDLVSLENPDEIHVSTTAEGIYTVTPRSRFAKFYNNCLKGLKFFAVNNLAEHAHIDLF